MMTAVWLVVGMQSDLEVVVHTGRRTAQGLGNAAEIDDDGLDTVPFALDLGLETLHLVAIEGIFLILRYVSRPSEDFRKRGY